MAGSYTDVRGWNLTPLPDKLPWVDRNACEYRGHRFTVARHLPTSQTEVEGVTVAAKDWCGWSADESLQHVIGRFTGESVIRFYADRIDAIEGPDRT